MKRPRRRYAVTLHLRSRAVARFTCGNISIKKSGNDLTSIELTRGVVPFYTRLDEVELIEVRRSWLHWEIS